MITREQVRQLSRVDRIGLGVIFVQEGEKHGLDVVALREFAAKMIEYCDVIIDKQLVDDDEVPFLRACRQFFAERCQITRH